MDTKVCRICLNKCATISLFDKQNDGMQYSTKIMRCVNVIIAEGDGLPNLMCTHCASELSITYEFIQKCEASDNTLRCLDIPNDLYADIQTKVDLYIKEEDIKDEPHDQDHIGNSNCALESVSKVEHFEDMKDDFDDLENNLIIDTDSQPEYSNDEQEPKHKTRRKSKFGKRKIKRERTGPIQCVICGLMVSSPSAMEIHMRTHTGEKPFSCQTCDSRFPTKGSLKRHTETYHSKRERKFTCETCGNSFFRKNDIITHMRVHTDERPYICPFCSKRFRQIASLIRHKRVHTGDKPYSCPICGKKFADKSLVKKHLNVHSDEKKFSCHLCNKSMKSKTALNTHLNLHSNEKQNICSFCGMAFAMKGNLQTHIRRVHSERSGQCSVCLKSFSDLEAHMRKHTGEKPFICGVCNHAFGTKRSLAHHMVFKHENAAKFKCSIGDCTKTFPTAMMLEFHLLKQHTNHTPYICQHCSRGFFRMSDLSRHLRVSHMDVQMKMPLKALAS